jgi:hypothetical protein
MRRRASERARERTGRVRPGAWSFAAALCIAALGLAAPAVAGSDAPFAVDDPFGFDAQGLPARFQYDESHESRPPSVNFRRNESRAVEAPTRYRTSSILKYSTPLGDTGMIFRVKLPLNPRKIIKLEVRF